MTIRTVDLELAKYFKLVCVDNHIKEIKGLVAEIRVLPKKILDLIMNTIISKLLKVICWVVLPEKLILLLLI